MNNINVKRKKKKEINLNPRKRVSGSSLADKPSSQISSVDDSNTGEVERKEKLKSVVSEDA